MIIPATYVFSGGDPAAMGKGPSLMFVALPKIFDTMWMGHLIGTVFFILVLLAALTSSISLMETVVSIICDKMKIKRTISCIIVYIFSVALGLVSCFGYSIWSEITVIGMQFLDFFDFISNSVIMPVVAFLTSVFIGYVIKPYAIIEEVSLTGKFKREKLFTLVIKYIAPVFIVLILLSSVLDVFGIFKI